MTASLSMTCVNLSPNLTPRCGLPNRRPVRRRCPQPLTHWTRHKIWLPDSRRAVLDWADPWLSLAGTRRAIRSDAPPTQGDKSSQHH